MYQLEKEEEEEAAEEGVVLISQDSECSPYTLPTPTMRSNRSRRLLPVFILFGIATRGKEQRRLVIFRHPVEHNLVC
jgi:hypothetical protein